jgi:hypothetical protein
MIVKAYIRVAEGGNGKPRIIATTRSSAEPIKTQFGAALPTVAFAIEFDVPDALFEQAEQVVATVTIPEEAARPIVATVVQNEIDSRPGGGGL